MLLVNSVSTAILFPGGSGSLAAGADIKRDKRRGCRGGGRQTVREFLIVFKGTLLIIIIIIIIFK